MIQISAGSISVKAQLFDTPLGQAIKKALPIAARGNTWGDEIYFSIPVDFAPENTQETVEKGDLAYWQQGKAFCIFFGPTPVSGPGEIRPASAVEVFGKIEGDATVFRGAKDGETLIIELF